MYMSKYLIGAVLGILISLYIHLVISDNKERKINNLVPRKMEELLEKTTWEISKKQKKLNRMLTEEEKNEILDECYTLIK